MPSWLSLSFQDPATLVMGELMKLHDDIMVVMLVVFLFISYIFLYLLFQNYYYKFLSENTFIESVWSVVPAFLIIFLAIPSMSLLFMMEDFKTPSFSFKIVAHQWYWTYISPLFYNFSFSFGDRVYSGFESDSMMEAGDLDLPRLLTSSSDLFIPVGTTSRLLISSTDVIHSFAVPSMGLKVDAVPGRINQLFVNPFILGHFFGQCSEICGSNHSFMPISVKTCSLSDFDRVSEGYLMSLLLEESLI